MKIALKFSCFRTHTVDNVPECWQYFEGFCIKTEMCFKKPKFDCVRKIEEEVEEGGGIVFDGGLDMEEDDDYDDDMWGQMDGSWWAGPETVYAGTVQVREALVTHTVVKCQHQIALQLTLLVKF